MSSLLVSLQKATDVYDVTVLPDGFTLEPRDGQQARFDAIVRQALNHDGAQFAAFPTSNGAGGYDSVLIIPIAS